MKTEPSVSSRTKYKFATAFPIITAIDVSIGTTSASSKAGSTRLRDRSVFTVRVSIHGYCINCIRNVRYRCVNGSTCVDGVDSYTCSCSVATSGPNCECSEQPDGEYECDATLVTDRATISVFNSTGRKRVSGFESTTTPFRVTNRTSPARFPNTRYTTTIDDVTAQTDKMISSTETVEGNNERTTSMATNAPTTTRKIPYRTVTGGATEIYEPAEITSLVVRTDASTFDTTFERSAETTNSEPNAISDSSIFEYVHFYSGSTRTRYETTLDWEDARTTTTETTFLDEYSNATAAPIPDQCRNVTCWNGGACDATDNGPKVSHVRSRSIYTPEGER